MVAATFLNLLQIRVVTFKEVLTAIVRIFPEFFIWIVDQYRIMCHTTGIIIPEMFTPPISGSFIGSGIYSQWPFVIYSKGILVFVMMPCRIE